MNRSIIDPTNLLSGIQFVTGIRHGPIITVKRPVNLPTNSKDNDERQTPATDIGELAGRIRIWGRELGFQQLGFSDVDLAGHEIHLNNWLSNGFHIRPHGLPA